MATAMPFRHRTKATVVLRPSLLSKGELKEDTITFLTLGLSNDLNGSKGSFLTKVELFFSPR